jgi:hypothetical protein
VFRLITVYEESTYIVYCARTKHTNILGIVYIVYEQSIGVDVS